MPLGFPALPQPPGLAGSPQSGNEGGGKFVKTLVQLFWVRLLMANRKGTFLDPKPEMGP